MNNQSVSCSDWRWRQCGVSQVAIMAIGFSVVGVLLLVLFGCLCKCFCGTGLSESQVNKELQTTLIETQQKNTDIELHARTKKEEKRIAIEANLNTKLPGSGYQKL